MLVITIAALSAVFLADRLNWWLTKDAFGNIQLAAAILGVLLVIELACFIISLKLGQRRSFSLRWLFMLTVAAAIPTLMYQIHDRYEERQARAFLDVNELHTRILTSKIKREMLYSKPAITKSINLDKEVVTALNFAIAESIGCDCCFDSVRSDVSDADLESFQYFPHLESLDLAESSITDEGLYQLGQLKNLKKLNLARNHITDAGLAHLRGLTGLKELVLSETQITDDGLVHLRKMKNLEVLELQGLSLSDEGLLNLSELKELRNLAISGDQITDNGLIYFQNMKKLERLNLWETSITVNGVIPLGNLKNLENLSVWDKVIYGRGIESLRRKAARQVSKARVKSS